MQNIIISFPILVGTTIVLYKRSESVRVLITILDIDETVSVSGRRAEEDAKRDARDRGARSQPWRTRSGEPGHTSGQRRKCDPFGH